jgi:hypothetical protein
MRGATDVGPYVKESVWPLALICKIRHERDQGGRLYVATSDVEDRSEMLLLCVLLTEQIKRMHNLHIGLHKHVHVWNTRLILVLNLLYRYIQCIQAVLVLRDRCLPKNRHQNRNRVNRDLFFFNEILQFLCECKCVILQWFLRLKRKWKIGHPSCTRHLVTLQPV